MEKKGEKKLRKKLKGPKISKTVIEKKEDIEEDIIDQIIKFFGNLFVRKQESTKENKKIVINKKVLLTTGIILFALIVMTFTMIKAVQRQINFNKRPELISFWDPKYKGQVGMPVYNDHQFIIDNIAREIQVHKKLDGTLVDIISLEFVPVWVAETSKGLVLVKAENSDNLYYYNGKKLEKVLLIPGLNLAPNFNIDSEDNIYFSNTAEAKILKYSLDGTKLLEFGGYGKGRDKFIKPGRIFLDKDDNLYVYDITTPIKIKVWTKEGKFIKEINTGMKELRGWESMAITHNGNIYINDLFENSIRVYSKEGRLLGKFTGDASGRYGIGIPNCLSGGIDNIVYVHTQAFRPIDY